uniref:Sodium/nucleoside cotransporter n=1 Tax=Equus asinus TaxID=9793 RepID=A0A8C4MWT5_EQUAS
QETLLSSQNPLLIIRGAHSPVTSSPAFNAPLTEPPLVELIGAVAGLQLVLMAPISLPLFVITVAAIFFVVWDHCMAKYEHRIKELLSPGRTLLDSHWFWLKWVIWSSLILGVVFWLIFDTAKLGQQQLVSFGGLIMFVILMFLFSKHPTKVRWRPVFGGIGLQFLLGLIILRTGPGFRAFQWLGKQIHTFLEHTGAGVSFVFGENYTDHSLAFKYLPMLVFFTAVTYMLYYLGLMQWIIRKIGWLMLVTVGSSPVESVVAAGSIFVGYTESPLLVRQCIRHATKSELHAIMTTGFATMAGNILGPYISFGISPTHLLTALIMSAPTSLALAKLFCSDYPTSTPVIDSRNLLEAASQGAFTSIFLVTNIAVNMIAFLALVSFVNAALSWFGNMFDYPQLSFEMICSYIFMPVSFMMGVDWQDCFMVAKLIGYKTFFTEFIAYEHLSKLVYLRKEAGPKFVDGVQQYMSVRSETIATYALCGFGRANALGLAIKTLSILSSTPVDINCHHILENAFASGLPQNTTDVVSCCQSLLNSTVVTGPGEVIPGGNHSLDSLKTCCELLKPSTLNCTWIPDQL